MTSKKEEDQEIKIREEFNEKLKKMDCRESSIKEVGNFMLDCFKNPKLQINDILIIWAQSAFPDPNQLKYAYLADFVVRNVDKESSSIRQNFWVYIKKVFPNFYHTLNQNFQKAYEEILNNWEKSGIYSKEEIDELKVLMYFEYMPILTNNELQNKVLLQKFSENDLEPDENLFEFAKLKETLKNEPDDNETREKLLKKLKEMISIENRNFKEDIEYLEELDKIMDKIEQYKAEKNLNNDNQNNDNMEIEN